MVGIAQIVSTDKDNLWHYTMEDGRGMALAMSFMTPFVKNKSSWSLKPDVLYWDEWPVRHPAFIFAAEQYNNKELIELISTFDADPTTYEIRRNLPLRYPLIWSVGNMVR